MRERASPLPVSWAEHWEDVRLWRVLGRRDPGYYVDVGAMDPSKDSVTNAFYERGWSGLDVEPNPHFAELLRAKRPRDRVEQLAAGSDRGRATLHVVMLADGEQTGLSTLDRSTAERHVTDGSRVTSIEVEVVPLTELMAGTPAEDPARFHFLKVDVEGHEGPVLRGTDLGRFRPLVIAIEARAPRSEVETHAEGEAILVREGYVLSADDGLNRWYVRSEDRELAEVLAPEINPLMDGQPRRWWEVARETELIERMEELDRVARESDRYAEDLRVRLESVLRSRSWRMTAPFRRVSRALRRMSGERGGRDL